MPEPMRDPTPTPPARPVPEQEFEKHGGASSRTTPPPKNSRPVHTRTVDDFGTFHIRPLDPHADSDIEVVHGWVGAPRAYFWGMNALTVHQVAATYAHMATLDTHHAFLVLGDDAPVALLQTYEPDADRVGACYEVQPGDIGVHLLLAPAGPGGERSGWTAALLGVVSSYVFETLRRSRGVVDPDVRNSKAIARFRRHGFAVGPVVVLPEIDLPSGCLPRKEAQLAFLTRESAYDM